MCVTLSKYCAVAVDGGDVVPNNGSLADVEGAREIISVNAMSSSIHMLIELFYNENVQLLTRQHDYALVVRNSSFTSR